MFGMEVETVRGSAVEVVALDGAAECFGMGGMHAELVGAAGLWVELDASDAVGC